MRYWGDIPNWAYDSTRAILEALKAVDPSTYAHCCRVGEMARKLARDAGLNEYEQKMAEFAGLLHDVGKMGVDSRIVHKPGKLDEREQALMRDHAVMSEMIVRPLAINNSFFSELLPGVRGHHERIDGEGYPDKLLGEAIPLIARVILVVDTFDAMSQDRAYRKGLPVDVVYNELIRCSGTQFDPQLVTVFLEAHKKWSAESADQDTHHNIILKVA